MMLLYGLVRCIASALRYKAKRAHDRAKALYETLQTAFTSVETECKAEEVALGRPVDYTSQLRLMKAFEKSEDSRQRWVRSAERLAKREKLAERVNGFQNARLPYTFGLIDMTVVLRAFEYFGLTPELTLGSFIETVKVWFT